MLSLSCSLMANRRSWTKPRHRDIAHGMQMAPLPLDWPCGGRRHWHDDIMFLMLSCQKYHGVGQWKLELRYPTVGGTYSYGKFKRKKDEKLCWYIFIISRTTTAQVDHNNIINVVRWRNPESGMISLVHLQGHNIGVTRNHELPEATLDPKRAPADHSAISAWRTDCNQSIQLNSVGGAQPPVYWSVLGPF